jgi:hypothetical protein
VKKVYDFFGASFTDRKLTARDIAVDVHGDSAYVEFYWHYSAKQKSDGKDVQTDGRESQMYRRVDGGEVGSGARALFRDASDALGEAQKHTASNDLFRRAGVAWARKQNNVTRRWRRECR